jgi:hypothetical protein
VIAAIDVAWDKLFQAAYVSAAFGIGVVLVGTVAVVASLRAQDIRRAHGDGATALDVVTAVCVIAIAAAVLLGLWVMTNK